MRIKLIPFAFLIFITASCIGQPLIVCKTQNNPDNSLSIFASSQAKAEYTLKIVFSALTGWVSTSMMNSNVFITGAHPGEAELIKFKRDNTPGNYAFQYRYFYFPGKSFAKQPDTSFEYLIPAPANSQVMVTMNSSTTSPLSQQLKTEYRGTSFNYKLGDTICAARAGVVYECIDSVKVGERTETIFNRKRNRIFMEHRDGTLGIYGIPAPIKLLVQPGDEVFPGQPLAVFTIESPKYRVYFSTCYLDEKKIISETNPDNNLYYIYMPTHFYGAENDRRNILQAGKQYMVQHSKEVIAVEMTKKEKKKFGY